MAVARVGWSHVIRCAEGLADEREQHHRPDRYSPALPRRKTARGAVWNISPGNGSFLPGSLAPAIQTSAHTALPITARQDWSRRD